MPVDEVSPTPAVPRQELEPEPSVPMTEPIQIVHVMSVQPVVVQAPSQPNRPAPIVFVQPIAPVRPPPQETKVEPEPVSKQPEISNDPRPDSKKNFEFEPKSKKDFEPKASTEEDEPTFDRDSDVGRWRTDDLVRELVIYRYEWKEWPEDVPTETGLKSYYELRYFSEGMNRKGERYADLYRKHRAKRDLWIDEFTSSQAIGNTQLDAATPESNVVPLRRKGASN